MKRYGSSGMIPKMSGASTKRPDYFKHKSLRIVIAREERKKKQCPDFAVDRCSANTRLPSQGARRKGSMQSKQSVRGDYFMLSMDLATAHKGYDRK
jgi:hypothetical protein